MRLIVTTKDGEHVSVECEAVQAQGDMVVCWSEPYVKASALFHAPAKVLVEEEGE